MGRGGSLDMKAFQERREFKAEREKEKSQVLGGGSWKELSSPRSLAHNIIWGGDMIGVKGDISTAPGKSSRRERKKSIKRTLTEGLTD